MIKINVIVKNKFWIQRIAKPEIYFVKKVNKLNLKNKYFNKKKLEFTLLLSDDKEIKKLNKKFRKKNKSTDVLSFPFHSKKNLKKMLETEKEVYLGDIIINFNKIDNKKNLKLFKSQFDKLWVHGLVHLLGHDHKKESAYKKMRQIESSYLNYIK